jgi:AraC-like DNA-binding protein
VAFWETPWAFLLGILAVAAVTGLVLYILLYICRLKRQQHEALEKYLALLEMQQPQVDDEPADMPQEESPKSRQEEADDMLMKRLVRFVEENLGDSNVSIDDMAQACAVSRTSLHRKVKEMTGTSPMEFMREARIRKAIHLIEHSGKSVSEIAYDCGFSDPKYFSKCFKAATGKTPTEYKNS